MGATSLLLLRELLRYTESRELTDIDASAISVWCKLEVMHLHKIALI